MSVCLLIGLFLRYELGFDKHNEKVGRVYGVNSVWKESNKQFDLYATPIPPADAIKTIVTHIHERLRVPKSMTASCWPSPKAI